jgi:TIR domain
MTEPRYMFFLAHTGRDTERAKELRNLLHPGVPIFLDTYDLVPGDEWDVELPRRQRQALATVALLSASTEAAYYLREEIASAIAYQRHEPDTHRLIPVYLDGVPKNPAQIPYGMRVRHALDAARLGMVGVAAELKKVATALAIAPFPSLPPDMPEPADRIAIFDALCIFLPPQFDEIVFRVNAPKQYLAPTSESLARRALDLVQWGRAGRLNPHERPVQCDPQGCAGSTGLADYKADHQLRRSVL